MLFFINYTQAQINTGLPEDAITSLKIVEKQVKIKKLTLGIDTGFIPAISYNMKHFWNNGSSVSYYLGINNIFNNDNFVMNLGVESGHYTFKAKEKLKDLVGTPIFVYSELDLARIWRLPKFIIMDGGLDFGIHLQDEKESFTSMGFAARYKTGINLMNLFSVYCSFRAVEMYPGDNAPFQSTIQWSTVKFGMEINLF